MVNIIIPYFKKMQKYMSQRPCITAIYPHVWQFNSQVSWLVFMNLSSFTMNMKYTQTAQKIKFSIKDIFSECDQIGRKLQIWSHCWKKSLMENFFFSCSARYKPQQKNKLRITTMSQIYTDRSLGNIIFWSRTTSIWHLHGKWSG